MHVFADKVVRVIAQVACAADKDECMALRMHKLLLLISSLLSDWFFPAKALETSLACSNMRLELDCYHCQLKQGSYLLNS